MSLSTRQMRFARMISELILKAIELGYDGVTMGEAYRTAEMAEIYAQRGTGIVNSLHRKRLAMDLNAFAGGTYLTDTEDYHALGEYWESLGGTWGGRFSKSDGNHFELKEEA